MKGKRTHKDLRYRDQCFPGAETEVFTTDLGGFAPLPLVSRELLPHLHGSVLKVWLYLLTKAGQYSICYPTYEEIMHGAGIESKGTVAKAINRLEAIELIRVHNDKGTRRYLLRDPRLSLERLYSMGEISRERIEEANDLLEALRRPLIEVDPVTGS